MKINWKYVLVSLGILGLELYQSTLDDERIDELEERLEKIENKNQPKGKRSGKR